MYIDSHTHLYLEEFKGEETDAVKRAVAAGVVHLMFPNVNIESIDPMKRLHDIFPDVIDMAMGLHPTEVDSSWRENMKIIEAELASGNYKAIGEAGVDLYWDKTYESEQREAFRQQCLLAIKHNLPLIIHCREGLNQVLDVFESLDVVPRGVFHSFGGTVEDVERIRKYGDFYFGINGIVTFKNSKLKEVLPTIGLDHILLETDAPYLAPVPKRGNRNESAFMFHTANFVASIFEITPEELAQITTRNYYTLFGKKELNLYR